MKKISTMLVGRPSLKAWIKQPPMTDVVDTQNAMEYTFDMENSRYDAQVDMKSLFKHAAVSISKTRTFTLQHQMKLYIKKLS